MGLRTVGVMMGLLLMPATAQAAPHGLAWFVNGKPMTPFEAKQQTIAWGTLTLESPTLTATCRVAKAGYVFNHNPELEETEVTPRAETVLFQPYECKAPSCPTPHVTAFGVSGEPYPYPLDWTQVAAGTSSEEYVDHYEVKLTLECAGQSSEIAGAQTAKWMNGVTAAKPSKESFTGPIKGLTNVETYETSPVAVLTLGPM